MRWVGLEGSKFDGQCFQGRIKILERLRVAVAAGR